MKAGTDLGNLTHACPSGFILFLTGTATIHPVLSLVDLFASLVLREGPISPPLTGGGTKGQRRAMTCPGAIWLCGDWDTQVANPSETLSFPLPSNPEVPSLHGTWVLPLPTLESFTPVSFILLLCLKCSVLWEACWHPNFPTLELGDFKERL